jgi:hypothetical protein
MKNVTVWIENNPDTGSIKPFEIFWQVEGNAAIKSGSCTTKENAEKSIEKIIKRNSEYYNITVR